MASTRTMGRDDAMLRVRGWDGSSLGFGTLGGADPLGFAAGDANLYRYVHNDPINRTDPTGLIDWSWLPWNWGSSADKWQPLQNQETQLIQQMNQILGTQYSSISQFTPADRARLEGQLGISIDWSAFPSVAVNELAPQTIGVSYVSEGCLYVAAAADAAAAIAVVGEFVAVNPSALTKLTGGDKRLFEEALRRIGSDPKTYNNVFGNVAEVCAEKGFQVFKLGRFAGQDVFGSLNSGVGIINLHGRVVLVQKIANGFKILGSL